MKERFSYSISDIKKNGARFNINNHMTPYTTSWSSSHSECDEDWFQDLLRFIEGINGHLASALEEVEHQCHDWRTGWDYLCLAGMGVIGGSLLRYIESMESAPESTLGDILIDPQLWLDDIESWFYNMLHEGLSSGEDGWNLSYGSHDLFTIDWTVGGCAQCSGDPGSSGICVQVTDIEADLGLTDWEWHGSLYGQDPPHICINFDGSLSSQITPALNLSLTPIYGDEPGSLNITGGTGSGAWGVGIDTEGWLNFEVSWDIGVGADGSDNPIYLCGEDIWCGVADTEASCIQRGIYPHPAGVFQDPPGSDMMPNGGAFPGRHPRVNSCCEWVGRLEGTCFWDRSSCEPGNGSVTCSGFGDEDTCNLFGQLGYNSGRKFGTDNAGYPRPSYQGWTDGNCIWYNPEVIVDHSSDLYPEGYTLTDLPGISRCVAICTMDGVGWEDPDVGQNPTSCPEGTYCNQLENWLYDNFGECEECECETDQDCYDMGHSSEYRCTPCDGCDWNCHCEHEDDIPECEGIEGCMDPCYMDYMPEATCPADCNKECHGCTDPSACNYYENCDPDYKCEYMYWPGNYVPLQCVTCSDTWFGHMELDHMCCDFNFNNQSMSMGCCECGEVRDACGNCYVATAAADIVSQGGCVWDCCGNACCGGDCQLWIHGVDQGYCDAINGHWNGGSPPGGCCPPDENGNNCSPDFNLGDGGNQWTTDMQDCILVSNCSTGCEPGGACVGMPKCIGT